MKLGSYNGTAFAISGGQIVLSPLASVEVRREDTGALASIFSDRAGLVGISNPMTADEFGRFTFHAPGLEDGYRIRVTQAASPGTEYTLRYQKVGTAGELDLQGLSAGAILVALSAAGAIGMRPPSAGAIILNGKMARSVNAGALTVALKTVADADPSTDSPVFVLMPTVTGGVFDGGYAIRTAIEAVSLTAPLGTSFGHVSAVASALYENLLWSGTALKIALSSKYMGGCSVRSTLPVESSPSSTSPTALYSDAVYSNVAVACIDRWKSTQTIAGTWASTSGEVQLYPFPWKEPTSTTLSSGSGTYNPPWDATELVVQGWGGGASGGGGNGTHRGSGGGGGAYFRKRLTDLLRAYAYAVGAAGTAATQGNGGNGGGTTTFGTAGAQGSATGGTAGSVANGGNVPGVAGGTATNGDENIDGGQSTTNGDGSTNFVSTGGDSPRGGKGGKTNVVAAGSVPGGGGSAANTTGSSGAGAAGQIRIEERYET
jgi:hypothetical protein